MILKVIVDDQLYELNAPEDFIRQAENFFVQMDRDMDKGWQMSREWVQNPSREDRCRIAADKLLTALEKDNHKLGRLMAGYILSRVPEIESVEPATNGEIQDTVITLRADAVPAVVPEITFGAPPDPLQQKALAQAEKEITQVYKEGRQWRFSVYDTAGGQWQIQPPVSDEQEAKRLRQDAFHIRYRQLLDG